MRRDMELIKTILQKIESNQTNDLAKQNDEQTIYHKQFLVENKFISGISQTNDDGIIDIREAELTAKGKQFLSTLKLTTESGC